MTGMFLGTVQRVSTRDGDLQEVQWAGESEPGVYDAQDVACVLRDGVMLQVSMMRVCADDKVLSITRAHEFTEPRLF